MALTLTVGILLARIAINPWVGTRPLLLMFLIPIIVSAYLGGMGPGLFATFLAGVVVDYFVLVPKNAFGYVPTPGCDCIWSNRWVSRWRTARCAGTDWTTTSLPR